jgi:murein DD-endopeptidase MepM/ murein hydrolase activator NlpD
LVPLALITLRAPQLRGIFGVTACALTTLSACQRSDATKQQREQAVQKAEPVRSVTALSFGYTGFATSDVNIDVLQRDHSISFWFLPQYEGAGRAVLFSDATGGYRIGLAPFSLLVGSALEVVLGESTFTAPLADPAITIRDPQRGVTTPAPRWRHVTLSVNADRAQVYLDGDSVGSFDAKGRKPAPPLYFGRLARSGTMQDQYYGLLAGVAVSDKTGSANVLSGPTLKLDGAASLVKLPWPLDAARDRSAFEPPKNKTPLRLPMPPGQVWLVKQGINSAASHFNEAAFSLDFVRVDPKLVQRNPERRAFGTPAESVGQPVVAAAAGEVVARVDCYTEDQRGGCGQRRKASEFDPAQRNLVCLRHTSEEHTCYLHLQHGSVRVRLGAQVAAGDVIARVGNTGARTAHLHFALSNLPEANTPGVFTDLVTVPFEFSDYTVSDDFGQSFRYVPKGLPSVGQWVCAGRCAELLAFAQP